MTITLALLRGINVGGRNKLPMRDLVAVLEGLGCTGVRTYIQSGNAVFERGRASLSTLGPRIARDIREAHGFEPHVLLVTPDDLERTLADDPFAAPSEEDVADPRKVQIGFLDAVPRSADRAGLEALRAATERFELVRDRFYLHAPDGIGRSKLAARAESLIGVPMTVRNRRTVVTLQEMVESMGRE